MSKQKYTLAPSKIAQRRKRRKILSFLISLIILRNGTLFFIEDALAYAPFKKTFIITAYYSPTPGQGYYVTGTFEGDKRLNGNGTNGADGTEVYPGMIAAPSTYAFGTGINCPGIVNGQIHDRGGAIVKAGIRSNPYDRLDLWFGYGDESLKAALLWGKRTITCTVYPPGNDIGKQYIRPPTGNLSNYSKRFLKTPVESTITTTYNIPTIYKDRFRQLGYDPDDKASRIAFQLRYGIISSIEEKVAGNFGPGTKGKLDTIFKDNSSQILPIGLEEGDVNGDVRILQQILNEMGYLKTKPTAIFGTQTKAALMQYQLDKGIINSANHPAAGYLGPGTQKALMSRALAKYYINGEDQEQIRLIKAEEYKKALIAKAEAFAKNKPVETSDEDSKTDPFTEALEALSQEWVRDHSVPVEMDAKFAAATTSNQFEKVKNKLTPILNPFQKKMKIGYISPEVQKIQRFLKDAGYFEGKVLTNYFGQQTKKAIMKFQLEQKIIESMYSTGAGIIGPKTIRALNRLNYQQQFTPPHEIARQIRAPAIHPSDLAVDIQLKQASNDTLASS